MEAIKLTKDSKILLLKILKTGVCSPDQRNQIANAFDLGVKVDIEHLSTEELILRAKTVRAIT